MFTWRVANLDLASKQISSFLACLTWWKMYSQHGAILEESTKTVSAPMIGILSKLQNDNAARYTFRASKLWPDCKGVNEYHSYCTQLRHTGRIGKELSKRAESGLSLKVGQNATREAWATFVAHPG
jgi:hypothetical protein